MIQARGRYRGDIDMLYCYDRDEEEVVVPDEFLEVEYIPVETVKEMLKKGEIKDGKTIIALQHYFLNC